MGRARILALCLAACLAAPWAASAQDSAPAAVLIADRVSVAQGDTLIAEGNVEAFQGTQRLSARRITYDRKTGRLAIEGPIRLQDGSDITILASAAELDADLQNGLLTGARMVLDQHVQMAALQIDRKGGRYTQLYKTSVTSCRICAEGEAPLWQIRARRVIHDREEKQLYFDDAQLRVLDVPIFYVPRLRLPDPTLDRASGFLIPSIRTTSQLSTGVKIPYFFRLGDRRDLTLSPYLSSATRTLDFRYRQAFERGRIDVEGGITDDDIRPGETRGYLWGAGAFALRSGFVFSFDVEWASDDGYLLDYGHPYEDRLDSELALTRVTRDSFMRAAYVHIESQRAGEVEAELPTSVADLAYERRFFPAGLGGEVRLGVVAHTHVRDSDADVLGRDVTRTSLELGWLRSWTFSSGIRADWRMGVDTDLFRIRQDSAFADSLNRSTPYAALTLGLPMTRSTAGATHFIQPIVQIGWTDVTGDAVPNDESGRVEFDQGNLLALSRFPERDAREDGVALAYGFTWTRHAHDGGHVSLSFGQVIRDSAQPGFSATSGLGGDISDLLLAGQISTDFGLDLTGRAILNDSFDVSKAELRGAWTGRRTTLGGTYVWLEADPAEGRAQAVSEFYLDGAYDLTPYWTASANWRYDVADTRAATAGLGLTYRNECVEVDLSLNRRYTSSTSVEPSTDFGFTIALKGFSASNGKERYVRSCS
ncbi:MAG: LPS-assembly protein LptD [Rhodobacteraceae bacterium]|nr:MAG: LPS-assembly protein LptD [Paracoccaceae bacterium]